MSANPIPSTPQAPTGQPSVGAPPSNFGASPVAGPSPNLGMNASGMQKVSMAVRLLSEAMPLVGASSEVGNAILNSIRTLSKHVPANTSTPSVDQATLQKMLMDRARQSAMMQQAQQGQPSPNASMPPRPPNAV